MGSWRSLYYDRFYHSSLTAAECLNILRDTEATYGDSLNPSRYESRTLDHSRVLLIFKGKRFGKAMRTEYLVDFVDEPDGCTITLSFHKELLGLPPMTPPQEIALFMCEKLEVIPKNTT